MIADMIMAFVVAAITAGAAAVGAARHPKLAYWWHWDPAGVTIGLAIIAVIDAIGGVAVAGIALHLHVEILSSGAGRYWANGAAYGFFAFLLLRLELNSFGLDAVAPLRLVRNLFADRIGPMLDASSTRSVARRTGELMPRRLGETSLELFRHYVVPTLEEDLAHAEAARIQATIRVARRGEHAGGGDWTDIAQMEASVELRMFVRELIIEHADAVIDLKQRNLPRVHNQYEAARLPVLALTMLVPVAAVLTAAIIVWQLIEGEPDTGALAVAAFVVIGTLTARWAVRRRQVSELLRNRGRDKRKVHDLLIDQLDPRGKNRPTWTGHRAPDGPTVNVIAEALDKRRLVLLVGDRRSGRSRTAFEALKQHFAAYVLLLPNRSADTSGKPPLTRLLAPGVLPLRNHYALWLDDVGRYVEAGLDPRLIERWLAGGRKRIAVGTITAAELESLDTAGVPAWLPLERAVQIEFPTPEHTTPAAGAAAFYIELVRSRSDMAAAVQVVVACELLALPPPSPRFVAEAYEAWTGAPMPETILPRLQTGKRTLISDEPLSVIPEVARVVEDELRGDQGVALLSTLTGLLEASGLLTLGAALMARRGFDAAAHAYLRAEEIAAADLQPVIAAARARLADVREGVSGATLSNVGGVDFPEPMGLRQRARAEERVDPVADDAFDATLPPETDRLSTRFYRLTVYRGLVRVTVLFALDSLAVAIAAGLALAVRAAARHEHEPVFSDNLLTLFIPGCVLVVAVSVALGLYRGDAPRVRLQQILGTMAALTTVVAAGFLVAKVDVGSIAALAILFAVAFLADCALRYGYDIVSRKWVTAKQLKRRILVLGNKYEARTAAKALVNARGRPIQPVGFASERRVEDQFCVGTYKELDTILRDLHISELVIVQRHLPVKLKAELIEQAQSKGIATRYLVDDHELVVGATRRVDDYGLIYAPAALITPEALELKRITDTIVVTVTLPIWALIIAVYAAYSKMREWRQPVFVVVDRVGLGISAYSMLRLRTRHKHANGSRGEFPSGRVEAWLERTGLDETPQVFNILRGEMSTVGPRPVDATEMADLSTTQKRTLGARPGMTGRWQMALEAITDESQLRAMDADYLQHWRITHDLELMLRTFLAILRRGFFVSDTRIYSARAKRHHDGTAD